MKYKMPITPPYFLGISPTRFLCEHLSCLIPGGTSKKGAKPEVDGSWAWGQGSGTKGHGKWQLESGPSTRACTCEMRKLFDHNIDVVASVNSRRPTQLQRKYKHQCSWKSAKNPATAPPLTPSTYSPTHRRPPFFTVHRCCLPAKDCF